MATILYLNKSEIITAFNRWELATPINGVTNLATIISNNTGVILRLDSTGGKSSGCNSAISDDMGKINRITIKLEVWYAIVNDIITSISNNIEGGGMPENPDAAWILGLFFNMSFINMNNWIGVVPNYQMVDAYNFWNSANSGSVIGFRITPKNTQNIFSAVNNQIGLNKIATFVDGSNIITANFGSLLAGKTVTFTVFGVNTGTGNYSTGVNFVNTINANGSFSANASLTIDPTEPYFSRLSNISLFQKSDFVGNIFYLNIGVGAGFAGVQADRMDDYGSGNNIG